MASRDWFESRRVAGGPVRKRNSGGFLRQGRAGEPRTLEQKNAKEMKEAGRSTSCGPLGLDDSRGCVGFPGLRQAAPWAIELGDFSPGRPCRLLLDLRPLICSKPERVLALSNVTACASPRRARVACGPLW